VSPVVAVFGSAPGWICDCCDEAGGVFSDCGDSAMRLSDCGSPGVACGFVCTDCDCGAACAGGAFLFSFCLARFCSAVADGADGNSSCPALCAATKGASRATAIHQNMPRNFMGNSIISGTQS